MSIEREQTNNSTRGSLRLAPNVEDLEEHKRKLPRQFVNFTFYRARPEWRMLDDGDNQPRPGISLVQREHFWLLAKGLETLSQGAPPASEHRRIA